MRCEQREFTCSLVITETLLKDQDQDRTSTSRDQDQKLTFNSFSGITKRRIKIK